LKIREAWMENLRKSAGFEWINKPKSEQELREQNRDE